jgi:DNA-binding NtrC family response regulator
LTYDNTQDAMDFIKNGGKYNLAIIDRMARIGNSGDDIINLSKKKNPHIPVISISEWGSKSINANANYRKGTSAKDLLNLINNFLR